jgi:hypothetical protein
MNKRAELHSDRLHYLYKCAEGLTSALPSPIHIHEEYLHGRVCFHIHYSLGSGRDHGSRDFCAVIERPRCN